MPPSKRSSWRSSIAFIPGTPTACCGCSKPGIRTTPGSRAGCCCGSTGSGREAVTRSRSSASSGAAPLAPGGWRVYEAGAPQLNAGMSFVGMLERRLLELRKRLAAEARTLWLVPDFHQLLWSGRAMQSPTGALEQLMPAFESGEILALGETRPGTLDRLLAERPEIGRLFEIVRLAPPPDAEVLSLLAGWAERTVRDRRVTVAA